MATKLRTPYNGITSRPSFSTPVSEKISNDQVLNAAGGYVYQVGDMAQLERFLVLGTVGGTYYASEQKLTRDNAVAIEKMIVANGTAVVAKVVEMTERVPKNDPSLFVLAMCAAFGDRATKAAVKTALPQVARIPTHLFAFIEFVTSMRGWGRSLREMVANWYTSKDAKSLSYGLSKYQSRNGWSNRDALRLSHAKTSDASVNAVFHWSVKGWTDEEFERFEKEIIADE
jgi:60 kDa SS-A/Ro ribonucleoprotein